MNLDGIVNLADLAASAKAALDKSVWAYVQGGAGSEHTVRSNVAAFQAVGLRPRILRTGCAVPPLDVTLLGQSLALPILLAPTSPQRLLHEQAELATARAAAASGTVSIVSTDSHFPFSEVAQTATGSCWFQLYSYRSRAHVEATIDMAIEAGARALVVTADATYPARRVSAQRAGFRTPPYVDFGTLRALGILTGSVPPSARIERLPLTWRDMAWVRQRTTVPLVIKGVVHPADALRCVDIGADGIIVSNHGGRQLDGVVPSLVALKHIAPIVRNDCAVLVDGGIRSGADIAKALALGAHAVCIGRPYLWGLAAGGESGVVAVLALLRREVEDTLRQLGLMTISELGPDVVVEDRCWQHVHEDWLDSDERTIADVE